MKFSLVMPYHNNPGMLLHHYEVLGALPRRVTDNIELVVCDDASDELPPFKPSSVDVRSRMFRIDPPHVPWSHRCATNIAAHEAKGDWLLVTDIDHIVPERTWLSLLDRLNGGWLTKDTAYMFGRHNMDGTAYKSHPDSWLFSRALWNKIKGYDERYRGHYGQNYPFIQRVRAHAPSMTLATSLIRVSRDDIPDASERVLERKSEHAKRTIANLRRDFLSAGTFLADTRLSARYRELTP